MFFVDAVTSECLVYQQLSSPIKSISIDAEIVSKHPQMRLLNDLVDCHISICSVEVPALFTENFDYQSLQTDFIHGVLTSDLLGKTIYCHIVDELYAARISCPRLYNSIRYFYLLMSVLMLCRVGYIRLHQIQIFTVETLTSVNDVIYTEQRRCILHGQRILDAMLWWVLAVDWKRTAR